MALAIANTPFDMPINYAKSGRAIYTWEVMQAYLPCDIEPFDTEPEEFDSRDDWHSPPGGLAWWHGPVYALAKVLHALEHRGGQTPR